MKDEKDLETTDISLTETELEAASGGKLQWQVDGGSIFCSVCGESGLKLYNLGDWCGETFCLECRKEYERKNPQ